MDSEHHFLRLFNEWAWYTPAQTVRTQTRILEQTNRVNGTRDDVCYDIICLYIHCILCGDFEKGDGLLHALLGAFPHTLTGSLHMPQDVGMILHYSPKRSDGLPLETSQLATNDSIQGMIKDARKPEYDITNPSFFQLDNWTMAHEKSRDLDPHSWRQSDDPNTIAACVGLLCRVEPGAVASQTALTEAVAAIKHLLTSLPAFNYVSDPVPSVFPGDVFPFKMYFLLLLHMGEDQLARDVVAVASSKQQWCLPSFLGLPHIYEFLVRKEVQPSMGISAIRPADAHEAVRSLTEALETRKQFGPRDPFRTMDWPELLRRFSEAAFHHGLRKKDSTEFDDDEIEELPMSPAEILLPPLTVEEIAATEARLGPIPQDIKEMSLIARGFKGGWHFAGGGFPGIQDFELDSADSHRYCMDLDEPIISSTFETPDEPPADEPDLTSTTTDENDLESDVCWTANGTVQNDDFVHVICPSSTCKSLLLMENYDMRGFRDGEYRVFNYSHWTAGPHDGQFACVRDWIVALTKSIEEELELERWPERVRGDTGIVKPSASG